MKYVIVGLAALAPALGGAQASAAALRPPPAVCANAAERHQFDFWIGDWIVTPANAPNFTAGTSTVQPMAGGCALLENWTAANGAQGKSINAYNPALKQWQQYWIGQDGNPTEYRQSSWQGKTLVFVADKQRLSFTPMEDGSVRQHGEIWVDSTKSWATSYDFRYRRKP